MVQTVHDLNRRLDLKQPLLDVRPGPRRRGVYNQGTYRCAI